jgi:DNA-binding transcriptional LysR family regulator
MNLSLREIEYIMTVAAEENITRASEKLYIAQPSLSQAIKKIEDEVGFPLFTRIKNKIKLTEEGKLFVEAGSQINKTIRDLQNRLHEHSNLDFGHLAIGMPYHLGAFLIPPALAIFRREYPKVRIDLYENTSSELEHMIMNGSIDIAILPLPLDNPGISSQPFLTSRMMLVMSKDNPLCAQSYDKGLGERYRYFDLKKAANEPFIIGLPGQRIRTVSEIVFKRAAISPRIVLYSKNVDTIKNIAASGLGLAIIPEQYLRCEECRVTANFFYLDESQDYTWVVAVAYADSSYLSPAARQFINTLRKLFENQGHFAP